MKSIIDCEINEVILRELNADEIEQQKQDEIAENLKTETEITQRQAKATQKAALLDRLGITEDEAKLLLE